MPAGAWDVEPPAAAPRADHVGLLLLDGVLSRELVVADQVSAELLGPGDLVRPWQTGNRASLLPVEAVWSVLVAARRSRCWTGASPPSSRATRRSPRCCSTGSGERSVRLATTQAISQLTRVDRRLRALFWHLAERWGRVSGQGVIVPLALTHRILGQLVGARRPDGLDRARRARRARRADPPAGRLVAAARRPAGRADAGPPPAAHAGSPSARARRFEPRGTAPVVVGLIDASG